MSMNYASAEIMNNLVVALDKSYNCIDYALSAQEYALSYNTVERNLQLLYGLSNLQSSGISMIEETLVFGKGLIKSQTDSSNLQLPVSAKELGFKITDILGSINESSNAYAFGAIYLTSDVVDGEELVFSLARPSSAPSGDAFLISKDVSLDDAENIIRTSLDFVYPAPSKDYYLEIYKFIADIEIYDQTIKNSRVFFKIIDERKPRGYFGYSEEIISKIMVPQIIRNYQSIQELYNIQKIYVRKIMDSWVGSNDWSPDFVNFWKNSDKTLPTPLLNYLQNEMSIII
jgi:hypothetical protein